MMTDLHGCAPVDSLVEDADLGEFTPETAD